MVSVNSPDGLILFIFATLGYCAGAVMFGFAGWVMALLSSLLIRAWGWFYYGFWWDMRYGRFSDGRMWLLFPCEHFGWFEEEAEGYSDEGGYAVERHALWRRTKWYERIIARWINEKGSQ